MTPSPRTTQRALLVGINLYPNLPPFSQLKGCVNDVLLMKDILEKSFGFPADHIVVLRDLEATGARIRQAMEELLVSCQPGDTVVFHFSGHGSQMAAKGDKAAGYDESIMPSDSGRMNCGFPKEVPPNDIRDTEIDVWLSRLAEKTPYITLLFDSCHSGSITRMVGDEHEGTRLRWIPPDPLPEHNGNSQPIARRDSSGSGWLSRSSNYVLLAACAADQGAYELDHEDEGNGSRNGAFTFFLAQELRQADSNNTYQDVWERVALNVNNRFRKQTPQLEGNGHRKLFDAQEIRSMSYLLVTERDQDQVVLGGGAVHGVSLDSQWRIDPRATKQIDDINGNGLGAVKITAVDVLTSRGVIISEHAPMAIEQGDRATETLRIDQETRMSTHIDPVVPGYEREHEDLQRSITQSTLLRIDDSSTSARALIQMVLGDGQPRWEVCDQSGARLMPHYAVAAPDSASRIKDNLETIWRHEKVLELRNPESKLRSKIDFVLLSRGPDGGWHEVDQNNACFSEGEKLAFRVINRTGGAIYVSVLDLGVSRRIDLLYPPAGAAEEISAGHRSAGNDSTGFTAGILSVGERTGTEIELYLPDDRSLISPQEEPRSGKEFFKLIATTRRHDLRFLSQPGLREQLGIPVHPLERMIYLATGPGSQRESRLVVTPEDEWLTIERSFWLRPRS